MSQTLSGNGGHKANWTKGSRTMLKTDGNTGTPEA